jgi:hypothetical protein
MNANDPQTSSLEGRQQALQATGAELECQARQMSNDLALTYLEGLIASAKNVVEEIRQLNEQMARYREHLAAINAAAAPAPPAPPVAIGMPEEAWPPLFQTGGAMSEWRIAIETAMAAKDPHALALFADVTQLSQLLEQEAPGTDEVGHALHELSVHAYRFWKAIGADLVEAPLAWRDAFQKTLDDRGCNLEIRLVYAKALFDMHTMLSAEGSSGRMSVQEPLSWILWDRSDAEHPRIFKQGLVISC